MIVNLAFGSVSGSVNRCTWRKKSRKFTPRFDLIEHHLTNICTRPKQELPEPLSQTNLKPVCFVVNKEPWGCDRLTTLLLNCHVQQEKRVANDWKPATPRNRKTSEDSDGLRGPSDGHSPPRRTGSGRVGRGGQRGGHRPERREREPRTPRDGEPGESGGPGRRGGRRGRGGDGGGTPGGMDRKSKVGTLGLIVDQWIVTSLISQEKSTFASEMRRS